MKIEVVSGQPGVDINQFFTELLDKNGINVGDIKQEHFIKITGQQNTPTS